MVGCSSVSHLVCSGAKPLDWKVAICNTRLPPSVLALFSCVEFYFPSSLTSSQLRKSLLRGDTTDASSQLYRVLETSTFPLSCFEGSLACVLSWGGSVFVLLNSLTPPGPVSSSLTTAAPWVRERGERGWGGTVGWTRSPVGSLLCCFKRCCLFTLKNDG